jgi:hypothetical protein
VSHEVNISKKHRENCRHENCSTIQWLKLCMQKFPRADVDLYKARRLRQEHSMLKNDAKSLLSELHAAMVAVHESARNSGTASEGRPALLAEDQETISSANVVSNSASAPFARIVSIEPGSPADDAGLHIGDKLCKVGTLRASPGAVNAIAAHLQVLHSEFVLC